MRRLTPALTTALDLATVALGVAAAQVGLGLWAALAAGAVGCAGLSWALSR
jgi:hypothetical protein